MVDIHNGGWKPTTMIMWRRLEWWMRNCGIVGSVELWNWGIVELWELWNCGNVELLFIHIHVIVIIWYRVHDVTWSVWGLFLERINVIKPADMKEHLWWLCTRDDLDGARPVVVYPPRHESGHLNTVVYLRDTKTMMHVNMEPRNLSLLDEWSR